MQYYPSWTACASAVLQMGRDKLRLTEAQVQVVGRFTAVPVAVVMYRRAMSRGSVPERSGWFRRRYRVLSCCVNEFGSA